MLPSSLLPAVAPSLSPVFWAFIYTMKMKRKEMGSQQQHYAVYIMSLPNCAMCHGKHMCCSPAYHFSHASPLFSCREERQRWMEEGRLGQDMDCVDVSPRMQACRASCQQPFCILICTTLPHPQALWRPAVPTAPSLASASCLVASSMWPVMALPTIFMVAPVPSCAPCHHYISIAFVAALMPLQWLSTYLAILCLCVIYVCATT